MRILLSFIAIAWINLLAAQNSSEKHIETGYDKYLNEDYEGAILDFGKAIAFDAQNAEAYYLRGVCYSFVDKKREAMSDLNKATELKPDYAEAYYEKGYLFLSDQNAKAAIEQFDKVLTLNPKMAEAWVSRGTAKCMQNDPAGAAADWQQAKKLGVDGTLLVCE